MGDVTNIERRQMMIAAINILAEPLHGEARERFLVEANRRLDAAYPPPSSRQMRSKLRIVTDE